MKFVRLRTRIAAASTKASAELLCRRIELGAGLDRDEVIDAFDAHGDLDSAVAAALCLHRYESQRRGKPHPQNAIVAGALTGDDDGVDFSNCRANLRAAFLRVDEFLQL